MDKGYLQPDVWRQKRDDEILRAIQEIDTYTVEAQMLIRSERERRQLDTISAPNALPEREPSAINATPVVARKGGGVIGCLASLTVTVIYAVIKVLLEDERYAKWAFGVAIFLGIVAVCGIIWLSKGSKG